MWKRRCTHSLQHTGTCTYENGGETKQTDVQQGSGYEVTKVPHQILRKHHDKARRKDMEAKESMLNGYDTKYRTKFIEIKVGDYA